jgi:hypothetical protein
MAGKLIYVLACLLDAVAQGSYYSAFSHSCVSFVW